MSFLRFMAIHRRGSRFHNINFFEKNAKKRDHLFFRFIWFKVNRDTLHGHIKYKSCGSPSFLVTFRQFSCNFWRYFPNFKQNIRKNYIKMIFKKICLNCKERLYIREPEKSFITQFITSFSRFITLYLWGLKIRKI